MTRLAYVNGRFVPHTEAAVHVEDRGYQFGDGVYEVVTVVQGRLVDIDGHLTRLGRSLDELRIDWPVAPRVLGILIRQLLLRNRVIDGLISGGSDAILSRHPCCPIVWGSKRRPKPAPMRPGRSMTKG